MSTVCFFYLGAFLLSRFVLFRDSVAINLYVAMRHSPQSKNSLISVHCASAAPDCDNVVAFDPLVRRGRAQN